MTTAAAVSESPPVAKASLRDFSDRLSPMLVKELRQGLKSPVFTWGLIAMQTALAVMAMVAMDTGNDRDANEFFWWSAAGIVCVLLPMRVANALRDEMGGNTLDTLVLTRLSAWRITLGKWLATGALQVLVAMTVLPYLIMRYFAGGVNMPMELAWLGVYVVFGLLVTAVMLGLSWFRYFLIRAVLMLGVTAASVGFCAGTIHQISRNDYGLDDIYRALGWPGFACIVAGVLWTAFFFLDLGAAQIAPRAENRATRRRLAALVLLVTVCASCLLFKEERPAVAFSVMVMFAMVLPCIQSLCEQPANYTPVLKPFVSRGAAGRVAGRLLYPGWHTGLWFCLLVAVAGTGLLTWHFLNMRLGWTSPGSNDELRYWVTMMVTTCAGVVGVMILPLVVWRIFRRMEQWNFWRWMTVLLAAMAFHSLILIAAYRMETPGINMVNHVLPTSGLLVAMEADMEADIRWRAATHKSRTQFDDWEDRRREEHRIAEVLGVVSLCSLAVWLLVALWLSAKEMRNTRRAEDELAAELRKDRTG